MRIFATLFLTAIFATIGFAAHADGHEPGSLTHKFYIEGRLGVPVPKDIDVDTRGSNGAPFLQGTMEMDYDESIIGTVVAGVKVSHNLRAEAQFSWLTADDLTLFFKSGYQGNAFQGQKVASNGETDIFSVMLNVIYDFHGFFADDRWPTFMRAVTPFVGVGVGGVHIDNDNIAPAGAGFVMNDSGTAFAFSWILGYDFRLTESVSFTSRYVGTYTDDIQFRTQNGMNTVYFADVDSEVSHSFSSGIKIEF